MLNKEPGIVTAGWRLLWQTQRMLWWVYAINLLLGFFSAAGLALRMGKVLDHSLAAGRLYHGFDAATFLELAANPDVQLSTRPMSSLAFVAIFFVFMLFATGGILESYARNRMLVPGEFFQGCGAFFWRLVRLLLWLVVVLLPVVAVSAGISRWTHHVGDRSPKAGIWIEAACAVVLLLLLMAVRLWFDMAQTQTVIEDQRGMTRVLGQALHTTVNNFPALFWMYLRISILGWIVTAAAFTVWVKLVPSERIGVAFFLVQVIAFAGIAARLWQRASEVIWYQRRHPKPLIAVFPAPTATDDTVQPAPSDVEMLSPFPES